MILHFVKIKAATTITEAAFILLRLLYYGNNFGLLKPVLIVGGLHDEIDFSSYVLVEGSLIL